MYIGGGEDGVLIDGEPLIGQLLHEALFARVARLSLPQRGFDANAIPDVGAGAKPANSTRPTASRTGTTRVRNMQYRAIRAAHGKFHLEGMSSCDCSFPFSPALGAKIQDREPGASPTPSSARILAPVYSYQRWLYQTTLPAGSPAQASCGMLSAKV